MLSVLALALATSAAHAQVPSDWNIHPDVLLTGADVPWGETIGSPTVVYNTATGSYFMFFESRLSNPDADCPVGEWAIGLATSPNGIDSWTVRTTPLITPDPNAASPTFHSCVAAHPGAHYREVPGLGAVINVFFKGEQANDACAVTTPSWGCGQYTGIGRYRLRFDTAGNFVSETQFADPVIAKDTNFGYPKPLIYNGTWAMSYGVYPNIEFATAPNASGPWTERGVMLDLNTVPAGADWVEDELYSSALACRDIGTLPVETFVGGRDTSFATVVSGALGKASSTTGQPGTWILGITPYFEWMGDDNFRHWDVLRIGSADYSLWYDERDLDGNNQIRLASTIETFTWNDADVYLKECTAP